MSLCCTRTIAETLRTDLGDNAALFLVQHADGFKSALVHAGGAGGCVGGWAFAAQVGGEVAACAYNGNEAPNYPPFSYLGLNIQKVSTDCKHPKQRTLHALTCASFLTHTVIIRCLPLAIRCSTPKWLATRSSGRS